MVSPLETVRSLRAETISSMCPANLQTLICREPGAWTRAQDRLKEQGSDAAGCREVA